MSRFGGDTYYEFEELAAGFALDALDEEERQRFVRLMKKPDESHLQLAKELRSSGLQLAFALERDEPGEQIKQQLLGQIKRESSEKVKGSALAEERPRRGNYMLAVVASVALLFLCLSLLFYALNIRGDARDSLEQIDELESELRERDELLSILESRQIEVVTLSGLAAHPDAHGKVFWDTVNQKALLQVDLPAAPDDREYQLWLIRDNETTAVGTFSIREQAGSSFFELDGLPESDTDEADSFTVTLEPEGGSSRPTGEMYLLGNID